MSMRLDPSDLQPDDDKNEVALDGMSNFVFVAKGKIKDSDGNELKVASVPPEWKMPEPKDRDGGTKTLTA